MNSIHRITSSPVGTTIFYAIAGAFLIVLASRVGSQTPTGSEKHHRFDQQIALILNHEKQIKLPPNPIVFKLHGLTGSDNQWACKGDGRRRRSDQTYHVFLISVDAKKDIVFVFKPVDQAYAITWRTDADGRLISTVFADTSAVRVVPNSEYARQFEDEKAYWDTLIPDASPTPSPSPTG